MSSFTTSDLFDRHGDVVQVNELPFHCYGGRAAFAGRVVTVKCFEDNSRVKELLAQPGTGSVLVVDGGGSLRNALLGDLIGADAVKNGWEGVLIYGAVRDTAALAQLDLGVYALGRTPRKSVRRSEGQTGLSLAFGGIIYRQDAFVYIDSDGILAASSALPAI